MRRSLLVNRVVASLALLAVLMPSLVPASPRQATAQDAPAVDLAAVVLTTADLASAGFEGYWVTDASPFDLAADAAWISEDQNLDPADVERMFADAGHAGSYLHTHDLPTDPDDPGSPPLRTVQTTAYLFADAEGAAAAYAVIADESQNGGGDLDNAGLGLGDASEMTVLASPNPSGGGRPNTTLELEILHDRVVLELRSINFDSETAGFPIFEPEEMPNLEALGERLIERAGAALSGESPNLAPMVLLLERPSTAPPYLVYDLLEGDPIRIAGEAGEAFAARAEGQAERGTASSLRSELPLTEAGDGGEWRLYASLLAFDRTADARVFVDRTIERLEDNAAFTRVEEVDALTLGDQALAVELEEADAEGTPFVSNRLYVRVGKTVAVLSVRPAAPTAQSPVVSVESLAELGEAQVACLETGACDGVVPMPEELAATIGTASGEEAGTETRDVAAAGEPVSEDLATYESPQYGYTLTFDPDVWQIAYEDENPDDPYDRVFLSNGTSLVGLTGDPTYEEDELADCVENYVRVFRTGAGISDVEPLDARGAEDEEETRA